MNQMKQWVLDYLDQEISRSSSRRKKFHYQNIEEYLIQKKYKSNLRYQEENGYETLVQIMRNLTDEGTIQPQKNSPSNGRFPSIPSQWWLLPLEQDSLWTELQMLKVSDRLNLDRYREHPEWQTEEEWDKIEIFYYFLKQRQHPLSVSKQERSFELFGLEKYLDSSEGKTLLQRLHLSLDDLRVKDYGEPFVFWPSRRIQPNRARKILITENLSFFHTCKNRMIQGQSILGYEPDMLIYGEGKKIEKSLSFLEEIVSCTDSLQIHYSGDMDPEGWGIYVRLKHRYPQYSICLSLPIYQAMSERNRLNDMDTKQQESTRTLYEVVQEIKGQDQELADFIESLWNQKRRIPQEILTIESLQNLN